MSAELKTPKRKIRWRDRPWIGTLLLILLVYALAYLYCQGLYRSADDFRDQIANSGAAAELVQELHAQFSSGRAHGPLMFLRAGKVFTDRHPETDPYILDEKGKIIYALSATSGYSAPEVPLAPILQFVRPESGSSFPLYGRNPFTDDAYEVFSAAPLSLPGFKGWVYVILQNRMRSLLTIPYLERGHWQGIFLFLGFSLLALYMILLSFSRVFFQRLQRVAHSVGAAAPDSDALQTSRRNPSSLDSYEHEILESIARIARSRAALEGREKEIKDVISRVAHDSRTPLFLIRDYAEDLLANEAALPEQKIEAERVRGNVKSLLTLLASLDEFDSIRDGHLPFEKDVCHLEEFAGELISLYRPQADKKGVKLLLHSPEDLSPVAVNIRLLERVLRNLIDNALRHTESGGSIELRLSVQDGGFTRMALIDTGCGIPAEALQSIFEPFRQVERRDGVKGLSGLGLAIVEQILKAHGSQIFVESKEGHGTAFWFDLPNYREGS